MAPTARELAVAALASSGVPHKVIASDLAVSPSTVSRVVARWARRLDVASRAELVRALQQTFGHVDRPAPSLERLTAAERTVVALAVEGLGNEAIAQARGVSLRTVANQLAAAYRKLGVGSRVELAARLGRRAA